MRLRARLIVVMLLAGAAGAASGSAGLLWPVDSPPAVSSNFCEYREGHLHAGIDVRTFGTEGVPCRASGDGYVSRLRA
jgi:murein DD-endopeptidase MepM/ murein hydrolase activator NlpD